MKPHLLKVALGPEYSFSIRHDVVPYFYNHWHYHPEIELIHILKGSGTQFLGDSIGHFKPDDMILVGANLTHMWRNDEPYFSKNSGLKSEAIVIHFAPDFMGLGYSQVPERQSVAPAAQVAMLAALLDALDAGRVDIVASDSGGAVAQLFLARYPDRVRTLLLTDCDTEPNSPPPMIKPVLDMANAGTLADDTAKWLTDKNLARATFGAAVYHDPAILTDDVIAYYVAPMVSTPLRRKQYHDFHKALAPNPLAGIEAALRRSIVPVRMVWGSRDTIFPVADAAYLDRIFARSLGIRLVPEGKLFFQEEFPDVIAEEALRLWRASSQTGEIGGQM